MKRILILCSEFPPGPGGIGTHAHQLANFFSSQKMDVTVITPQDYAEEEEIKRFNSAQPFMIERLQNSGFKPAQIIKRFLNIRRVVHQFNPSLVIASGTRAIWMAAILLHLRKTPWVVIGHGKEFGLEKGLSAWLTRITCNQADAVISVSQFTASRLRQMGITKPTGFVIHNGADSKKFYPLPKTEVAEFKKSLLANDAIVLLTVGHVSDRKGQEVVIRSLPQILKENPNVQYWMAGLPQKQAALEALSRESGVQDHVRFWGRVSNETLLNLYNTCDIFVMASRQVDDGDFEGYGIAVIEAALCGKTAVVSDNSGLTEAVKNDVTGLIVPQNDPNATAEAIIRLTINQSLRTALCQQAHQNALENQTWKKVGERYVNLLTTIYESLGKEQECGS